MDQKYLIGIALAVALVVLAALVFTFCEYKQQSDLSSEVQGRWEHVDRTKLLTVGQSLWRIDRWDDATKAWNEVNHGTWTVRETGTFIFVSELNNAPFPVKIEGDTLWFEEQQFKRAK